MSSVLLNTIVVLLLIVIFYYLLRFLFKKLVAQHFLVIQEKNSSRTIAKLLTGRRSNGFTSVLIDETKQKNKEVAEIDIIEDKNSIRHRNLLLIDNSGSTAAEMDSYKEALKNFVNVSGSNEENALYTFSDKLEMKSDFTNSISTITRAIDSMQSSGATAMNDGIIAAVNEIESMEALERRDGITTFYNIIMFTDGFDNISMSDQGLVRQKLVDKSIFVVCTKESDLPFIYEIAKNPRNVFLIDNQVSTSGNAQNQTSNGLTNPNYTDLKDALIAVRKEGMTGRGSVGYVMLPDQDNPKQKIIKGYVNALGEIYSCGKDGEGSSFKGLCASPFSQNSKVFKGEYINPNVGVENYNVSYNGNFGSNASNIPVSPVCLAAGAIIIYKDNPVEKESFINESVMNAFAKTAVLALIIWSPLYLIYWMIKSLFGFNLFNWLGKEFDITITQLLLFFTIWFILNGMYLDILRKKKKYRILIDGLNNIIGNAKLNTIIIGLSSFGVLGSLFAFYPFSYVSFFTAVWLAFMANRFLFYGGGMTWPLDKSEPDYIPTFNGAKNGQRTEISFKYKTAEDQEGNLSLVVTVNKDETVEFESIQEALSDFQSESLQEYLEKCIHLTAIVHNYTLLSEYMIAASVCKLDDKKLGHSNGKFKSISQILLSDSISREDKLVLSLAVLKQGGNELIFSVSEKPMFGVRTASKKTHSPFIFDWDSKAYYLFTYNESIGVFEPTEQNNLDNISWKSL